MLNTELQHRVNTRPQSTLVTWTAIVTWTDNLGRTRHAACTGVNPVSVNEWADFYRGIGRTVSLRAHRNASAAWRHNFNVTGPFDRLLVPAGT